MLPFQSVSMDFITDLPPSNNYDSIMVVIDHDSSKGIILIPCTKTIDALSTAKLYHDNIYQCFGLPRRIISNQGPQFASQVFQTLCTRLGIKSKLSMAYHPQTDGQTEHMNQEVEAYLRTYCGTSPHTWTDSLTDLEFSHNIQTHSVTKTSPFNIILRSCKLAPKREGPFSIIQVLSPLNYRLNLPPAWKIHPVFHTSLLSTYTETDTHGPPFTQPPPDQIEGHQEFEIEAIVSHKGNGNRCRFLIKWTGYPSSENQWLPETALSHAADTLKAYKNTKNL
ncbi:hypothetical protein M0805_005952 [Coniferiporia weirii]|nr:hypothetical protein M0805_005952 [Coniferiporia weirii]